jgi:hypothetical protein
MRGQTQAGLDIISAMAWYATHAISPNVVEGRSGVNTTQSGITHLSNKHRKNEIRRSLAA